MSREFTLKREIVETFKEGWGVAIDPIFDEDTERVVDIDFDILPITEQDAVLIGNVWCVGHTPIVNFVDVEDLTQDDTHDLRTRWFAIEEEARTHALNVLETWQNPPVWVSFVTLD